MDPPGCAIALTPAWHAISTESPQAKGKNASLAKTLDPIRAAAKKKAPEAAAKAYDAASAALGDYLAEVELPGIADPRYK